MPSKTSASQAAAAPPSVGTFINNGALELVEVLGVGGYGVVYRGIDTNSPLQTSYAVKCLIRSPSQQSAKQRQLHIREIALHQLASAHPNVVTLHRIIDEGHYTFIVMEYASDGDLFTQILHSCRYLGKDHLIKYVFLQILDAVQYCHSLGIYHRDLKPENVLCFDGGLRVAITDFGLATTDRISDEFRTGSVYHMSPECLGGEFAPAGTYSPLANDIWSLAVILLNLATGRNPWKSASQSDATFQAYLDNPQNFLPTVLPISTEINNILVRMLDPDWRRRMPLDDVRNAIENIETFYSDDVIFEGSMARCPWEAGVEVDSEPSVKPDKEARPSKPKLDLQLDLQSHWSEDSDSEMVFATNSGTNSWDDYSSSGATWGFDELDASQATQSPVTTQVVFEVARSPCTPPSTYSPLSPAGSGSGPSMPVTPSAINLTFDQTSQIYSAKSLTIDTNCGRFRYATTSSAGTTSTGSSTMHTAYESYTDWSSSFFLASPNSVEKASLPMPSSVEVTPRSAVESREMDSLDAWEYDAHPRSHPFADMMPSPEDATADFNEPEPYAGLQGQNDMKMHAWPGRHGRSEPTQPTFEKASPPLPPLYAIAPSAPIPIPSKKSDGKLKSPGIFNHIHLFPRSPKSSTSSRTHVGPPSETIPAKRPLSPAPQPQPATIKLAISPAKEVPCRESARLRTKRHWFSSVKLFAGTGACS